MVEFKDFSKLDKNLTQEERDEWNAIYASYRSGSIVSGCVAGVDYHNFEVKEPENEAKQSLRCLIVIQYRVKVIIPETDVMMDKIEEGGYILHSMCGAKVEYIITHIDRENCFAVASRKQALRRLQGAISRKRSLVGKTVDVNIVAVGRNACLVNYSGYDVRLYQRDVSYSVVNDLREMLSPGDVKHAIVTEFSAKDKHLKLSIKETTPHPFDGVEVRHPEGSTRIATISGKYAGGVFCRLYDNVTDVLCSYDYMHYDGDFQINDTVEIQIRKLNFQKKLIAGKILRKIR